MNTIFRQQKREPAVRLTASAPPTPSFKVETSDYNNLMNAFILSTKGDSSLSKTYLQNATDLMRQVDSWRPFAKTRKAFTLITVKPHK